MTYSPRHFLPIWTLLSSIVFINVWRELYGYEFPVYATNSCPGTEIDYQVRSSRINCSETNLYMCVPNESLTSLYEFCYFEPVALSEGLCLYLDDQSAVDSYECDHFTDGCPHEWHYSQNGFEHPNCWKIKNGCFLADLFCQRKTTTDIDHTHWIIPTAVAIVSILILTCYCAMYYYVKKVFHKKKFFPALWNINYEERQGTELIIHPPANTGQVEPNKEEEEDSV